MKAADGKRAKGRAFYFVHTDDEDRLRALLPEAARGSGRLVWQALCRLSNERRIRDVRANVKLIAELASVRYRTAFDRLKDLKRVGAIEVLPPSGNGGLCGYRMILGFQQAQRLPVGAASGVESAEDRAASCSGAHANHADAPSAESDNGKRDVNGNGDFARWAEMLAQTGRFTRGLSPEVVEQGLSEVFSHVAWSVPENRERIVTELATVASGMKDDVNGACQWIGGNAAKLAARLARESRRQGKGSGGDVSGLGSLPVGCSPGKMTAEDSDEDVEEQRKHLARMKAMSSASMRLPDALSRGQGAAESG